jgi:DNA-binding Lrp family transcriptional regulator
MELVVAFVLVTLTPGSEKTVSKLLTDLKEVVEVDELYGEYDVIMKVKVSTLAELDTFLTDKIRSIPDVYLTSTMIVANQHKGEEKK